MGKVAAVIIIILAGIFLYTAPSPESKTGKNLNSGGQRSCLKESDIEKDKLYTCPKGDNKDVAYYRIARDIKIEKKLLRGGQIADVEIPASCQGKLLVGGDNGITDRAVRQSRRCTDPDKNTYEIWCGDNCRRVIEDTVRFGALPPGEKLCDTGDGYLGCFNQDFVLRLKDPPFNENAINTFDLYIRADGSVPEVCGDVQLKEYDNALKKYNKSDPALLQCLKDLQTQIKCKE